jgi:hypothetical protein
VRSCCSSKEREGRGYERGRIYVCFQTWDIPDTGQESYKPVGKVFIVWRYYEFGVTIQIPDFNRWAAAWTNFVRGSSKFVPKVAEISLESWMRMSRSVCIPCGKQAVNSSPIAKIYCCIRDVWTMLRWFVAGTVCSCVLSHQRQVHNRERIYGL